MFADRWAEVLSIRVHQRAAERVAGAEPVHDVQPHRRHLDDAVRGPRQHAVGPLLDDRDLDAEVEEGRGRLDRVARPDRHLDLVAVPHGDRRVA